MAKYGVIRTDQMFGTDDRNGQISVKYMGSGTTSTAIENGNVVKVDGLLESGTNVYERQIFKAVTPDADTALKDLALIASPEVMYDERLKDLSEFRTEAGDAARAYRLRSGDIFSVTAEALDGDAELGSTIEVQAGVKLKVATGTTGTFGKVIAVETAGGYKFYVIRVA